MRGDVRGASAGNGRGASAARGAREAGGALYVVYDVRYDVYDVWYDVYDVYDVQVSYDIFEIFSKRLFSGVFGTTKTFECHFRAFYIVL